MHWLPLYPLYPLAERSPPRRALYPLELGTRSLYPLARQGAARSIYAPELGMTHSSSALLRAEEATRTRALHAHAST